MKREDYIKDAGLLIKHARDKRNKNIVPKTRLDNIKIPILPSFRAIQDGWRNLISGLGGAHAKSSYTTYRSHYCLNDHILYALWQSNGMARKIINAVADDSVKNGMIIENDTENDLSNKFKRLNGLKNINLADKYRRHFGGSIILVGANDGQPLEEELNINNIKSIDWLKVYSRTDVFFTNIHFSEDINSKNYGQPEFYTIIPKYTTPFNVHYTRVCELKGLEVPAELDNDYRYYWGMSIIEPLWEIMKKNGASLDNVEQLLYEITVAIYKIKDLAKLICEKRWDDIKEVINTVDLSKSTINSIIQDSEDDYKRDSITFAGIRDILEAFMLWLSGESEIPVARLFGKQLGGLNNEGKEETRVYYDMIKARQENDLFFITQKIIDYINISKEFNNKVKDPLVTYNSPWQLTEKEELDNRKIQSEIDIAYIDKGVTNAEEVRENRIVGGYSYEMGVEESELETEVTPP